MNSRENALLVINEVTCVLSLLGGLVVLLSYAFIVSLRTKLLWKLVVCLAITDTLTSVVYLLPHEGEGPMCDVQALLGILFPVQSFLFTSTIGLTVFLTVRGLQLGDAGDAERRERLVSFATIFSTVFPVILTIIIWRLRVVGPSELGSSLCWIPYGHKWYRLLGGKLIEFISFILVSFFYFGTIMRTRTLFRQGAQGPPSSSANSFSTRLLFIPIAFIVLRVPSCARTIYDFSISGKPDEAALYWLSVIQAFCTPGQGFVNGACFLVWKPEVWLWVRIWTYKYCCSGTLTHALHKVHRGQTINDAEGMSAVSVVSPSTAQDPLLDQQSMSAMIGVQPVLAKLHPVLGGDGYDDDISRNQYSVDR